MYSDKYRKHLDYILRTPWDTHLVTTQLKSIESCGHIEKVHIPHDFLSPCGISEPVVYPEITRIKNSLLNKIRRLNFHEKAELFITLIKTLENCSVRIPYEVLDSLFDFIRPVLTKYLSYHDKSVASLKKAIQYIKYKKTINMKALEFNCNAVYIPSFDSIALRLQEKFDALKEIVTSNQTTTPNNSIPPR